MLSWEAKQEGDRRCAPACGRGCTQAQFDLATKRAERLARRLGEGWKPVVWENLGWHAKAVNPDRSLAVYVTAYRGYPRLSYQAFLGPRAAASGGGRWAEHGNTPEAAIRRVVAAATTEMHEIAALLGIEVS